MLTDTQTAEFVRLLTMHQPDIYFFIRTLVFQGEQAADLLGDTNLALWASRDSFQMGTNFRAWAFQTARHKILQWQARRRKEGVGVTVTKIGPGALVLTGANDYAGLTTVAAGTLELGAAVRSQVFTGAGVDIQHGKVIFDASNASTIQTLLTVKGLTIKDFTPTSVK